MHIKDLNTLPSIEKFGKDPLVGSALCDFALFTMSSEFLTSLLPEELELATSPFDVLKGMHPVFVMANDTDLRFNLFLEKAVQKQDLSPELHYEEFIFSIPYVQFKQKPRIGSQGPYIFLPVLYLNSIIAVIGGRIFYEFNKNLTSIVRSSNTMDISLLTLPLVNESFKQVGSSGKANTFPNFNTLSPIFALPTVEFGPYGYVESMYTVAYENVDIQPGNVEIDNKGSKYMPKGVFAIPDITTSVFGAFRFEYNWSLSYAKFIEL